TAPGLSETRLVEYRLGGLSLLSAIVGLLVLDRRHVADGFEEPVMVEPPHPLQGRELDILMAPPGSTASDHLRLEKADHRFGQGVVIGITPAAYRGLDASFRQALRVANGKILHPTVAVMYEPVFACLLALADGLLESVE